MKEEISRILKIMEEGKIDSEKATELIDALYKKEEKSPIDYEDKALKVKVISQQGDNVNVNIPVKVAKAFLKATGKIPIPMGEHQYANFDMNAILEALDTGLEGKFVDVKSSNGDIVEVWIE